MRIIRSVFLCAFTLIFCDATESNSLTLERKVIVNMNNDDYIFTRYDPSIPRYDESEFMFVVSVGIFVLENYDTLVGKDYEHLCFGNMVTLFHALTLFFCHTNKPVWGIADNGKNFERFYVTFHPYVNTVSESYAISSFQSLNDYFNDRDGLDNTARRGPAIAVLSKEVEFITSLDEFPLYGTNPGSNNGVMILFNNVNCDYSVQKRFIKMDVSKWVSNPTEVENGFYVKLNISEHSLEEMDLGSPAIFNGKILGILTDKDNDIGIIQYVYQHGKEFTKKNKLLWSEFRGESSSSRSSRLGCSGRF